MIIGCLHLYVPNKGKHSMDTIMNMINKQISPEDFAKMVTNPKQIDKIIISYKPSESSYTLL